LAVRTRQRGRTTVGCREDSVGEDDSTEPLRPEQASDLTSSDVVPPARGWYRVPDNPNYEHFWDGQKWTSQRYWGGAPSGRNESRYGPPPVAGTQARDMPTLQEVRPTPNAGPSDPAPFNAADPEGQAPPVRFYSVTTIIVPPVFMAFLTLIAISSIPHRAGRPIGIGAAVLAVLFAVWFLRRPYVAIARSDGSLTFKTLTGSKVTTVSSVSRIGLSTGARGGSSWIFHFDGDRAVLGDIGGKALERYVVERNPAVEHPTGWFSL
jgi:hypothetical protein